jgi:hypothetical protein
MARLKKATNAIVILVCLLFIVTLARNYHLSRKPDPQSAPEMLKGEEMEFPEAASNNQLPGAPTLILILSKSCHLCEESMAFYQKLTAFKNSSPQGLRLVAAMYESKEEAQAYLKEHGIGVDRVIPLPAMQTGLRLAPALLLLNVQNKLEESWFGKLSEAEETRVLERLKKACAGCSLPATAASTQTVDGKR